jgi:hypothetical protein
MIAFARLELRGTPIILESITTPIDIVGHHALGRCAAAEPELREQPVTLMRFKEFGSTYPIYKLARLNSKIWWIMKPDLRAQKVQKLRRSATAAAMRSMYKYLFMMDIKIAFATALLIFQSCSPSPTVENANEAFVRLIPEASMIEIRIDENEVSVTTFAVSYIREGVRTESYLLYFKDTNTWKIAARNLPR